jgi:porphobilinogen synthase
MTTLPFIETLSTLKDGFLSIPKRPRRNRSKEAWRALCTETTLLPSHLVYPLFITEKKTSPITSMPGIFRFSLQDALREIEEALSLGIKSVNLFFHIDDTKKDPLGTVAYSSNTILTKSIRQIKSHFPEVLLMADIALDPFTSHGLDGLIDEKGKVLNDQTLVALGHMSLRAAEAGVDILSPSDMMDGRIRYLRNTLDQNGFFNVGILSYAVKFASSLYSPFREALGSTPRTGDKKSFQLNSANAREALLECSLDEEEGADMLLIKPGIFSLDIIAKVRAQTNLPLGCYQVSGEYSMIKAAAERGWIDEKKVFLESLLAMRRAGADFILTYAAKICCQLLT